MKSTKKKKLAFGGTAMNIDSPTESISKIKKNSEDAAWQSMYDPLVMGLKGLGGSLVGAGGSMAMQGINQAGGIEELFGSLFASKPKIKEFLPGADIMRLAMGGTVGAASEVEGEEAFETPDGQVGEFEGPSHEQGGINIDLPNGTDVYSKRVKGPDGKAMSDRKKEREKKQAKLEELLKKNPTDKLLKTTLAKVQKDNELIDSQDMAKMNFIQELMGGSTASPRKTKTFAAGGTTNTPPDFSWLEDFLKTQKAGTLFDPSALANLPGNDGSKVPGVTPQVTPESTNPIYNTGATNNTTNPTTGTNPTGVTGVTEKGFFKELMESITGGGGFTTGDAIGIGGNLLSTFGGLKTTLANRDGDTPNVNAMKGYGEKGLNKLNESKGYIEGVKNEKLKDLELSRTGAINRNNSSARSLNTMRALNLAVDESANNTKSDIYNQFASMMQGIMQQEAGMLNQQDQVVMGGEQRRDEADRLDRDNFFTNLSQNIASMGTGVATVGKNLNQVKSRNVTNKTLNQLYDNFKVNSLTGEVKAFATEEIKRDPTFYSTSNISQPVADKLFRKEYTRKGDQVFNKQGQEINLKTGEVIEATVKPLEVDIESLYDIVDPFNSQQA